ncbi:hypothetical protein HK096_000411 [Nowakowskiella sp. JEL0078]|nr:hypothetical protein HK096_000411 [Nowakowskiella sp. JEL0078]
MDDCFLMLSGLTIPKGNTALATSTISSTDNKRVATSPMRADEGKKTKLADKSNNADISGSHVESVDLTQTSDYSPQLRKEFQTPFQAAGKVQTSATSQNFVANPPVSLNSISNNQQTPIATIPKDIWNGQWLVSTGHGQQHVINVLAKAIKEEN